MSKKVSEFCWSTLKSFIFLLDDVFKNSFKFKYRQRLMDLILHLYLASGTMRFTRLQRMKIPIAQNNAALSLLTAITTSKQETKAPLLANTLYAPAFN
jgi:hypothetical protein